MWLSNKIWKTRIARIRAATRLTRNDFYSQLLVNYYSLFIVIVAIIDIQSNELNLSLLILILSILILCTSLFISSRDFKRRALALKNCYTSLDKLYYRAKCIESKNENNEKEIQEILDKYTELLSFFENHSKIDYLDVKNKVKNEENEDKLFWHESFYLYGYRIIKFLIILLLFIFPIIACRLLLYIQ